MKIANTRHLKSVLALGLTLILAAGALCGCSKKPTAEDAEKYVKAALDLMCTGDYDHSVKIDDIEAGTEGDMRDEVINSAMESLGDVSISSDVKDDFKDVLVEALSKCHYNVGEATAAGDGEYDVTVTIEPLLIFDGVEEKLNAELETLAETENLAEMSERETNDLVFSTLIKLMRENLADPAYGPAEEITVHYGLLEQNGEKVYGVSEEDGEKIGSLLFSTEGL